MEPNLGSRVEYVQHGEELKMAELEGKWEGIEEADKPNLVMGVP